MHVVQKVLLRPKYFGLAVFVTLSLIIFAAWLPNFRLISASLMSSSLTLGQKITLLTALLGSLQTNFTTLSLSFLIASALLMGIQAALVTSYIRQTARLQQDMGISFVAMSLGLLGIGCASCGSVLLATLLGFGVMSSIVGFLPFKGQELSMVGILILLLAVKHTIKKINQPVVCEIRRTHGKKISPKTS